MNLLTLTNSIELYSNATNTLNEIYYGSIAVIDSFEDLETVFSNVSDPNIDVSWESINIADRFVQQAQSIKNSAEEIFDVQNEISTRSYDMSILPKNAITDVVEIENRISELSGMLREFGNIDISGLDPEDVNRANIQLKQSQNLITNIRQTQEDINRAISENNIEAMNADFERLNSLANGLENVVTRTRSILEEPLQQQEQRPPTMPEPPPVEVPVVWQFDDTETPVFTETGVDRFNRELENANALMSQITENQSRINTNAISVMSEGETERLNALNSRIDYIRESMAAIESNPLNVGTDAANSGLETLRTQLNQALQIQEQLNGAISDMDPEVANAAYQRLLGILNNTERYIRDNTDEQMAFNRAVANGQSEASKLLNTIKGFVGAYVGIKTVGEVIDLSDTITQTTARLDLMNDGTQTTEELFNKVQLAAQNARSEISGTADIVARFGNNAKDAFNNNDEVIAFASLVQKQMTIAGASTAEANNAILQLSQGLGSGVLRGDELNSVFEQAPNLIQNIADYMGVPIGEIRNLASEGQITADIVKNAIFSAADDINQKFESMPMTFGQMWTSFKNNALEAFIPILERINAIANSPAFQNIVNNAINAISLVAWVLTGIFELVVQIAGFINDNWSIIGPIIYGVAAAFAVYYGWLLLTKGLELLSAAASGALAVSKNLLAAAMMTAAGATWAEATAQLGLNGAMYACPIVWIIMLIIALIAIIYAVCAAIARFTGITDTGFGLICGIIATALAFVGNLFVDLINFAIDLVIGIWNFIALFANFFGNVFNDPVNAIVHLISDMADTVLSILQSLASAIDTIFGSNLAGAVNGWRSSLSDWVDKTFGEQDEIMPKLQAENIHLQRFEYGSAFNAGAQFGDGIADKVSGMFDGITNGFDMSEIMDNSNAYAAQTADNTGKMADSFKKSEDILDMIKDSVSRERIAGYTTKEIKIDMSGMSNNIASSLSIGDVVKKLANGIAEAAAASTEG